jgi:PAS domain S-box-containing protein
MKGKSTNPTSLSDQLIWIGIGLAAFWWFLESAVHVFVFHEGELSHQIFTPEPHETWMRLIVVAILIAFAVYAQFIIIQRKRAEQATEHAYAELNQIFETAADGMRVIDKDFNVLRNNQTFLTLSGVSKSEAAHKKCYEVFPGPTCHTPGCSLVRILGGEERIEYDVEKKRVDGRTVPCIVAATPFVDPRGEFVGIVEDFKDISERKHAEDALQESEEKYSTLVENSLIGIYIDQDGKIMFANNKFAEIYGYPRDQLIGMESRMLVHPEDRALTDERRTKRLKGEEAPSEYEARGLTKDGEIIWIARRNARIEYGGMPAILGNIVDITEHKRAEETLRQSEERFRAIFQSAQDSIFVKDKALRYTHVNPAMEKRFGLSSSELLGKTDDELLGEGAGAHIREVDRQVLEGKIIEEENTKPVKGIPMTFHVVTVPMTDSSGQVIGLCGIARDITERKLAEQEKEKLQAQLLQAQKMQAIGTLAGGTAHDFNNLLMGIQGNVSLVLMDIDFSHPHYQRLSNIEKQVQSGARLTSLLLGYARKGKYEIKPIDLNRLLEDTSEAFGRTRKGVSIHRELVGDLSVIEADPGQIEQVLLNLFVNAADAMPGGGDLILKTINVTHNDMKSKLYDPKPGNYVLLTVTDTGIGMHKKTMERIFDPFFTTKERGRGTGLGLASAYGIIKGHGGYIDVYSKIGQGTTFSIYLLASEKEVDQVVKAADQVAKGTGTVLLVDDEEVILEVGKDLLEAMGYQVLIARGWKRGRRGL